MAILFVGPTSGYASIAAAMLDALAGDTIQLESGYRNELALVSKSGIVFSGDASSTGIVLQLATGIPTFTVVGTAPFAIRDAVDANGLVGNAGDNLITVTAGADAVDAGLGDDRLVVDYRLAAGAITGTAAHFTEAGAGARSVTLTASTIEHFTVLTGVGADTLTVGDGDNIINSGAGADTVTTGHGDNAINLGSGANTATAGNGANSIIGGNDADTITVLDGGNFIDAGNGVNTITSGNGNDTILSGTGTDTIVSGGGADLVTLRGGADTVSGGAGNDRLIIDYGTKITNVSGGIVSGNLGSGYVGHIADLAGSSVDFEGSENFTITTGRGHDLITTGDGIDVIGGGVGNDTIHAGGGVDRLDGGAGADSMDGGAGNDLYFVDNAGDVTTELLGGGHDRVISARDWTLGDNFEWLSLSGLANLNGTGNALANQIDGNRGANHLSGGGGNDTLDGGAGADRMEGGSGNDLYFVDNGADDTIELAGGGYDRVIASRNWTLRDNVEWLSLSGNADLNAAGNTLANRMDGNGGANVLDGGAGDDLLFGNAGADNLLGGLGLDRLHGGDGADRLDGGEDADSLYGGADGDLLLGRAGNDLLDGGTGADSMVGGEGNDVYFVDNAGDVLTELAGAGYDRAISSVSRTLEAHLDGLSLAGGANLNGTGNSLANQIFGNVGANRLDGGDGNDALYGGAGADTLIGGLGSDRLFGEAGADVFRFATASEGGDLIVAYNVPDDRIEVSAAGFGGGLSAGMDLLASGQYAEGLTGAANSAAGLGQFVFETDAMRIWWDADGVGGADEVLLASMTGLAGFGAGEFVIIA
jgi:Ca2+-binding RTX toxin-like protein